MLWEMNQDFGGWSWDRDIDFVATFVMSLTHIINKTLMDVIGQCKGTFSNTIMSIFLVLR
jgi:hypothetical protein